MNSFELSEDSFDSRMVGNKLVVQFKARAMDILIELKSSSSFRRLMESAQVASNLDGYVQIKDSRWDSHTDVSKLSRLVKDDDELYAVDSRYYGYQHEVLMARFRNTVGHSMLALRNFVTPMVAGLQGRVSAEYLGLTLLFDVRIVAPDTTISFDNVQTGIPSSPCITLLMPSYIGAGKTLALANQGAVITAQEALDMGLVSRIIERDTDLTEACIDSVDALVEHAPGIVDFNRQQILPSDEDIGAALEVYYKSVSKMIIRQRANRE